MIDKVKTPCRVKTLRYKGILPYQSFKVKISMIESIICINHRGFYLTWDNVHNHIHSFIEVINLYTLHASFEVQFKKDYVFNSQKLLIFQFK